MLIINNYRRRYNFTAQEIDKYVYKAGGNYKVGIYVGERPIVIYVGRAADLNARLKQHLYYDLSDCEWFSVFYESDEEQRYYNECHDYHRFGGKDNLRNKVHPDKPDGSDLVCPCCRH